MHITFRVDRVWAAIIIFLALASATQVFADNNGKDGSPADHQEIPGRMFRPLSNGEDWVPVYPEDLQETSEPGQPNADAVILYREYRHNIAKKEYAIYYRLKILTQKGKEKWSDVEIPYNKKYAEIKYIQARTIKQDGTIIPFEGMPMDRVVLKGRNIKVQAWVFTMPQVEVGSVIEYRYKVEEKHCCLPVEWIVQTDLYQRKAYFLFSFANFPGNFEYTPYLPPDYPRPQWNNYAYELALEQVPALEKEAYMPPASQIAYRVRFYYVSNYGLPFWAQVAKDWEKSFNDFGAHNHGVRDAVDKIVNAGDTPEQKIRKIYDEIQGMENLSYLQNQTYVANKKENLPENAEQVLQQRRGSSNQLARLYVVMARDAGLHAYLMQVAGRDRWLFDRDFRDARQLDNEIAIVEIGGKNIFLDPGTKFCPYGLLDWPNTGVEGIRGTENKTVLFYKTPLTEYTVNKTERIGALHLLEDGSLSGTVTLQFYGADAMQRRQEVVKKDEQQRAADLEEELKKMLPDGATVKQESLLYQNDLSHPLTVRFNVTVPHYATVTGKRVLLPAALIHPDDTEAFTHATRVLPIYFQYPFYDVDQISIDLPKGMTVEDAPEKKTEKRDYAFYNMTVSSVQQAIQIHREFAMGSIGFKATRYPDLKAFYEQVRTGDGQQIVLGRAAASTGNGAAN